jgi:hypothetical protein
MAEWLQSEYPSCFSTDSKPSDGRVRLILEDRSSSTRENALFSLEIIVSQLQAQNVLVVTNKFHQSRTDKGLLRSFLLLLFFFYLPFLFILFSVQESPQFSLPRPFY